MKSFARISQNRLAKVLVGISGVAALFLTTITSANAATTSLWAGAEAQIVNDHRTGTGTVKFYYDVFITTPSADLEIRYGNPLEVVCRTKTSNNLVYEVFRSTHNGTSQFPLTAYGDGILMKANVEYPRGTTLNGNKSGEDTVWCDAKFTPTFPQGEPTLYTSTNRVRGYF